jgi:hypothetical protein
LAKISPTQELAIAALVTGSTVTEAAEQAAVSRETVSRWVHRDPDFIAELQNTRAEDEEEVYDQEEGEEQDQYYGTDGIGSD